MTVTVAGDPTFKVMVLCTAIWLPDRIIFQVPDFMAEKGIPLMVIGQPLRSTGRRGKGSLPCRSDWTVVVAPGTDG